MRYSVNQPREKEGVSMSQSSGHSEASMPIERWLAPGVSGYFRYSQQLHGNAQAVIRDPVAWSDFWYRLTSHPMESAARTPAPQVDFDREMIIAVGCGSQTDGHTVEIDYVTIVAGDLVVRYRRGWDPDQGLTDSFSTPIRVVRVPRDDTHRIVFTDTTH